jgi:anti-sigma factor RsiW
MSNRMINEMAADNAQHVEVEFDWLMSLALDDQLDDAGRARLKALTAEHDDLALAWKAWQWIDSEFSATPSLTPPSGFVQRFEARLAEQEQQRQQRVLLLSAALAIMALFVVFLSTAGVGAFVLLTQGHWIGEQIRLLTLAYTSTNLWFTSSVEAAAAVAQTPQAQIVGALYALVMASMVAAWVQLLRRSARLDDDDAAHLTAE